MRTLVVAVAIVAVIAAAAILAATRAGHRGGSASGSGHSSGGPATALATRPSAGPHSQQTAGSTGPAGTRGPASPAPAPASAAVRAVSTSTGAAMGLSITPVGSTGRPWTAGTLGAGAAWSTIKVPLVMASLSAGTATLGDADVRAAIISSDNAAAERLTRRLGNDAAAASAVKAQLVARGDTTTVPARVRTRPDFSVLGQTSWRLDDQAAFLATAACRPHDAGLLKLMGQIEQDQRWGLGALPGARFKGGWGPDTSGHYLVRQVGLVTVSGRSYAVAMAARAPDGSFAAGTAALDQLATRLPALVRALLAGAAKGRC
ncbi:hypothetical protein C0Z10_01875 [Acidipropionibacterium jensenii]|uniref:Serine hydrolase n=1 Tax=Acidipropionibacterium jensenii TaxID=1749 RepID=A0A3T0RWT9_9ACTN|nr:hypothetical protein C0Z10_01875 [Acidipropionibacterium jensenii]